MKKGLVSAIVRTSILIIAFGLCGLNAAANPPLASKLQIGMFLNSKTCIVMENDYVSYSVNIKDAVQKYWKSTAYEFINPEEFERRRFDSKFSFIVLTKGVFAKDPGGVSYTYIRLVLGGPAKEVTQMPEFCSIPISYTDDTNNDYEYLMPAIIKFMQKHVTKLEKRHLLIALNGLRYYNGFLAFNDKVLLLNKARVAGNANTPEKIHTVYPYAVKLLTIEDIRAELAKSPENSLFNFHIGPPPNSAAGKCFEMIFDVEGNLYYFHSRKITNENEDGFNLDDFKNIR